MTDITSVIEDRLRELRSEIQRLEVAREALTTDGRARPARRRRARTRPSGRGPRVRGRRRRQGRMDARERQAQVLHRVRQHGPRGVSISDLAADVGVSRNYLASTLLPPLNAEITRTRGRVAPKT